MPPDFRFPDPAGLVERTLAKLAAEAESARLKREAAEFAVRQRYEAAVSAGRQLIADALSNALELPVEVSVYAGPHDIGLLDQFRALLGDLAGAGWTNTTLQARLAEEWAYVWSSTHSKSRLIESESIKTLRHANAAGIPVEYRFLIEMPHQ